MSLTALLDPVCGPPLAGVDITSVPGATLATDGSGQWCFPDGAAAAAAANVPDGSAIVSFAIDPFQYISQMIAKGAVSLLGVISKWAVTSTNPDLTAEWWRVAYARGFAIGTVLFGFVLLIQLARSRKGDGADFIGDTGQWVVGYFAGVFLGPVVGQMLINGFGFLTAGIISKWGGTTAEEGLKSISDALMHATSGGALGDMIGSILMGLGILLSSLALFVSLCLQAVILYLSSALFAIGFVWVLAKKYRHSAFKIPILFVGVCAAKPLLFFLLGIGMDIMKTALFGDIAGEPGKNLAMMIMAISIFLISAFCPMLLLKFAPVMPSGTSPTTSTAGGGGDVPRSGPAVGAAVGGRSAGGGGSQTAAASRGRGSGSAATGGGSNPAVPPGSSGGGSTGSAAAKNASRAGGNGNIGSGGGGYASGGGSSSAGANPGTGSTAGSSSPRGTPAGRVPGRTSSPSPNTATGGGASSGAPARGRHRSGGGATGGTASQAMSKLAALAPPAATAAAGVSAIGGVAARGRRRAHNLTKGMDGDQPWS